MITNEVINHAIDYILQHIHEKLTVDQIAAHCHFSKYHFSRLFKAQTGESVYAFIKRLKLEQSAFRLKVEPKRSVTDISYDYGYSPSNYSWMFHQQYQVSPVDFRSTIRQSSVRHPFYHNTGMKTETLESCQQKIQIRTLPDYFVLYERRLGSYRSLSQQWDDFIRKYRIYITDKTQFLERTFDDPAITDADNCLYDICMSVDRNIPLSNTCTIQGGTCAVYAFQGQGRHIYAAYQSLFTVWLPQTCYEIDDRCGFDIYHKIDSASGYMELDICLPLKQKS